MAASHWSRAYFTTEFIPNYTCVAMTDFLESEIVGKSVKTLTARPHTEEPAYNRSTKFFLDKKLAQKINETSNNLILSYSLDSERELFFKEHNWHIATVDSNITEKIENKLEFRKMFSNTCNFPKHIFVDIADFNYNDIKEKLGDTFVVQIPNSSGGQGTFIISSESDISSSLKKINLYRSSRKKAVLDNTLVASEFKKGSSGSACGVATKWGTFTSPAQYQITSAAEVAHKNKGDGVFNGHDWVLSQSISESIKNKIDIETKAIGDELYKMGYRGYFGVDFIIDNENEQSYIIECNPRITGAEPVIDMMLIDQGRIPLMALHLIEHIEARINSGITLDYESIQSSIKSSPQDSSHVILGSHSSEPQRFIFNIKPGVYTFENNRLIFQRDGYSVVDLKNENEFILTEMVHSMDIIKPYNRIARILFKTQIIEKEKKFTSFAINVINEVYKSADMIGLSN